MNRTKVPELLTVTDAAERLALSTKTVRRLYRSGELPFVLLGGRWIRIDAADLARYIDNRRRQVVA